MWRFVGFRLHPESTAFTFSDPPPGHRAPHILIERWVYSSQSAHTPKWEAIRDRKIPVKPRRGNNSLNPYIPKRKLDALVGMNLGKIR